MFLNDKTFDVGLIDYGEAESYLNKFKDEWKYPCEQLQKIKSGVADSSPDASSNTWSPGIGISSNYSDKFNSFYSPKSDVGGKKIKKYKSRKHKTKKQKTKKHKTRKHKSKTHK